MMSAASALLEALTTWSHLPWGYLDLATTACALPLIILILSIYYWYSTPCHRHKTQGSVGCLRKFQANRYRASRKVGSPPPPYPNGWYRLASSDQLKPGQVMPVTCLEPPYTPHVLDAYCPHLGADMSKGGVVAPGGTLVCPFHGWKFSGKDGKCVDIPYSTGKVPCQADVASYPCIELNNHIYVYHHADPNHEPEWFPPALPQLNWLQPVPVHNAASKDKPWRLVGVSTHEIACHIEEVAENAGDLYHLTYLHEPGATGGTDLTRQHKHVHSTWWPSTWLPSHWPSHQWRGEWAANQERGRKHESEMLLEHSVMLGQGKTMPFSRLNVTARQIGPSIAYLDIDSPFGRLLMVQSVTPLAPLLQSVRHEIWCEPRMIYALAKLFWLITMIQFERDVQVWECKQYLSRPVLVKEDSTITRHRRWYRQFYDRGEMTSRGEVTSRGEEVTSQDDVSNPEECKEKIVANGDHYFRRESIDF